MNIYVRVAQTILHSAINTRKRIARRRCMSATTIVLQRMFFMRSTTRQVPRVL